MYTIATVKHGYVLKHILLRFKPCLVVALLKTRLFQTPEKAFRNCVIPAITFSTHATDKAIGFQ
jgi:hypothetical protein